MRLPETDELTLAHEAGVLTITLARPARLNSLTAAVHAELRETLSAVRTADGAVRCVLLTGTGRAFSAGQDLAEVDAAACARGALGEIVERDYNALVRAIATLDLPVIAAVNGVAAGAGANIALACDIVIAARSASFIQSFEQLGLVPDAGGTWVLPRLIGLARARALALTGEPVSAERAEAMGMIWRTVDDERLAEESRALAGRLATRATAGLAFTKQLLLLGQSRTLDEQLDLERDYQRASGATADFAEGLDAFRTRRTPGFRGR